MDRILGQMVSGVHLDSSIGEAFFAQILTLLTMWLYWPKCTTLISALSLFEEDASELGLHTNWLKTKVQSLNDFLPRPANQTVQDGTV